VRTLLLFLVFFAAVSADEPTQPEHPRVPTSSPEFLQGVPSALKAVLDSNFEQGLETPGLAASSDQEFQRTIAEINSNSPIASLGNGDPNIEYDVILQPGHYQRTTGRTGTQGKYVSEQALAAYTTNIIVTSLRRSKASVLVVSADSYLHATRSGAGFNGLRCKIFLAIHADGSVRPCSTGPSLGYKRPSQVLAMHMIGLGLADALGYDYTSFRKDNFTANEAGYYMFSQVQAQRLTGLLEVGELTCEKSERELVTSSHAVGANVARALDFVLRTNDVAVLKARETLRNSFLCFERAGLTAIIATDNAAYRALL